MATQPCTSQTFRGCLRQLLAVQKLIDKHERKVVSLYSRREECETEYSYHDAMGSNQNKTCFSY